MIRDLHVGDMVMLRKNVKLYGHHDTDEFFVILGYCEPGDYRQNWRPSWIRIWDMMTNKVTSWSPAWFEQYDHDLEILVRLPGSQLLT